MMPGPGQPWPCSRNWVYLPDFPETGSSLSSIITPPRQPLNWPTCTAGFASSQTDWALFSTTWAKESVTIS